MTHLLCYDSLGRMALQELLTTLELAARLKLKTRGIQTLTARKILPVIRLSARCIRYDWEAVKEALAKRTVNATK